MPGIIAHHVTVATANADRDDVGFTSASASGIATAAVAYSASADIGITDTAVVGIDYYLRGGRGREGVLGLIMRSRLCCR